MHQNLIARIPSVTGLQLREWFSRLESGPAFLRCNERAHWLSDEHGLSHGYATAIVHEYEIQRRTRLNGAWPRAVDIAKATSFLSAHPRAVLATMRADGRPQLSPIVAAVDDVGRILISTREPAIKAKNLARDPRASLCVLNEGFFGEWVQADGTAELIHLPEAMPILEDYYRRISGEHPDWADYREAMRRDKRLIIRITVDRAGPDVSG
jgi:PPOX class probable F420-dependent enzyme